MSIHIHPAPSLLLPGFAALVLSVLQAPIIRAQNVAIPEAGPHIAVEQARAALRNDLPAKVREFMKLHNDARAEVGVPPLVWDEEIAAYAQEWAETIAAKDEMEHRPNGRYGENLAGFLPQYGERPVHGAKMWYDEIKDYNGEKIDGQNFMKFGHYTQMVWRQSTKVGFGMAMTKKGMVMLCANYAPGGNMIDEHPYREGGKPAPVMTGSGKGPKTDRFGNVIPDGPPPVGLEKPIDMPAADPGAAAAVAAATNSNAARTFIETLNDLRAKRGLPAQRLDPRIVAAAQWLANHMAKHEVMDHDAVLIGGPGFQNMRDIGDRLKAFSFIDAGAAEACAEGEHPDIGAATRDFTLGWANGNTHYRPFLSKDGQVFETCGFGIAPSKKTPGKFYACALFANRDAAAAPAAAGGTAVVPMPAGRPAEPGAAVGGIVLKFTPGWTTVVNRGVITSVSPGGKARVVITLAEGPKNAADGPWDAIQADMANHLAPHFPGLLDLAEVSTEHDVFRDNVGLRVVTYTATFEGKPVDIVVDFAREKNLDGDRLVLIMRCSEQGDAANRDAAREVAESLRLRP